MHDARLVASHYTHGDLLDRITAGVTGLGKTPGTVTVDDLGAVDEFHIGGRAATAELLDRVGLDADHHVLDVGCGLGGASRFVAERFGCRVTGIDLTAEFVDTGRVLCEWVGLADRVRLHHEDATAMSFAPESFDRAYMLHVGMNIPDKRALAADVYRVLRPGAILGIYDVMRVGPGELEYPVPWASAAAGSALATAHEYRQAAEAAGFRVLEERDRRAFALEFFARMRERIEAASGPPPLGLHVILGARAPEKLRNMVAGIASGAIAPVELLLQKVGG